MVWTVSFKNKVWFCRIYEIIEKDPYVFWAIIQVLFTVRGGGIDYLNIQYKHDDFGCEPNKQAAANLRVLASCLIRPYIQNPQLVSFGRMLGLDFMDVFSGPKVLSPGFLTNTCLGTQWILECPQTSYKNNMGWNMATFATCFAIEAYGGTAQIIFARTNRLTLRQRNIDGCWLMPALAIRNRHHTPMLACSTNQSVKSESVEYCEISQMFLIPAEIKLGSSSRARLLSTTNELAS